MTRIGTGTIRTATETRDTEPTVAQLRAQNVAPPPPAPPPANGGPEPASAHATVTGANAPANAPPPMPGADGAKLDYGALLADDAGSASPAAQAQQPLKRIEDSGLEVPRQEKLDTIAQALPAAEAARLRTLAASSNFSQESIDAAYASVLDARKTPGEKQLALDLVPLRQEVVSSGGDSDPIVQTVAGPPATFQAKMDVGADGRVNGKALGVDELATLSSEIGNVSSEAKRAALEESGLGTWAGMASPGQQDYALAKLRQAAGTPGNHALDFSFTVRGTSGGDAETPFEHNVEGKVQLEVGADRKVNGGALPIDRKLAEHVAFENKEWPAGTPEARERGRIEAVPLAIPQQEKLATLSEVLSPQDAATMKAMVETGTVPAEQIDAAYASVLEARTTPGAKDVSFALNTVRTEAVGGGDAGPWSQSVADPSVSFTAKMDVGADGSVNGKPLGVDQLARLSSQLSTVPAEAKDAALRDAGLSEDWVAMSTPDQKEYALAKIRQASLTPGQHELDLSRTGEVVSGGDAESRWTYNVPGKISLNVGTDGLVNGKPPAIERALATTLVMERLPMVEKRQMMAQLGIPPNAVQGASATEASDLLTRVALRTQTPGEQQFDVGLGGRTYIMGLKVGPEGQIEGSGAVEKPKDPPAWKKWIGPILTVASFVFPPAAPFLQAANAAIAVSNGAKGLGLVAAVAGGFAGVSQIAGFAGAASTASTVAQVAGATNGLYVGAKTGDWLGAVASGASLVGALGGAELGSDLSTVRTVGQVAGYASRVVNGDFEGLLAEGVGRGIASLQDTAPQATQADVRRVDNAIDAAQEAELPDGNFRVDFTGMNVRLGDSGTSTVRLGTGDDGASLAEAPPAVATEGPTATQADVRRIDNEIRATQRTPAEVREDFDRAFAAARQQGLATFTFDRADGRGALPYTTGTREEAAARMAGGSTDGYRAFLRSSSLRDSEAALASYGRSLTPAPSTGPATGTFSIGTADFDLMETFGVPATNGSAVAAADAGRALAASNALSPLARLGNSAVNSLGIVSDSLMALVPGTESNRAVTGAMVSALGGMRDAVAGAVNDPAGAARALERGVGTLVRTAMDPREWPTAGEAVVRELLRPFGDLADTLSKDPSAVNPGELAVAAFGAASAFNPRSAGGVVSKLEGRVGQSLNGTFESPQRTLHFTGNTKPRGETLVVSDIGLFEAGGVAHRNASGADMIRVKDDVVEWGRLQGFSRVELNWVRGGAEVNGTSAHPGETFSLVYDTETGKRIRSGADNTAPTPLAPTPPSPAAPARPDGSVGTLVGRVREQDAASFFNRAGYDARVSNVEVNARNGGTEIDIDLTTPNGRFAVLVGGDAKALSRGQMDEAKVQESLDRYYRARDIAIDPEGPYRNDGAGAIMAFPAGTDPRVIARFEAAIGPRNVVVFTPPGR